MVRSYPYVLEIYMSILYGKNKDIKKYSVLELCDQVSKVKSINLTMEKYKEKPKLFTRGKK